MFPPPTPLVKNLMILNAIIFLVVVLPGFLGYPINIEDKLALYYPASPYFRPYQFVSHFFMHADPGHIFFNMLGLYFFGPTLEERLGPGRFLLLYIIAAIGAMGLHIGEIWWKLQQSYEYLAAFTADPSLANFNGFFSGIDLGGLMMDNGKSVLPIYGNIQNDLAMGTNPEYIDTRALDLMQDYVDFQENSRMVGASGAVFGVLAAFAVFFPDREIRSLFIPFGIPAVYLIGVILGSELFLGVMNYNFDSVAHYAHIGGAIAGGIVAYVFKKTVLPPWLKRMDK